MSGNFFADLHKVFVDNATRPCFIFAQGGGWSFADLEERIGGACGALLRAGVRPGNRVVAQIEKSPEAVVLYLASLRVGAVYVPLNTAYTASEVEYFIDDAKPALFVCDPEGDADNPHGAIHTLDGDGEGSFAHAMSHTEPFTGVIARKKTDVAAILYTSGTTGRSKGAMLTHENLRANAMATSACWSWGERDVLLHALPIFHVHGLFIALHCSLLNGTTTIFARSFAVAEILEWLPRATVMMGVPTYYARLLKDPSFGPESCAGVRLFISGSAPLTEQAHVEFERRTGQKILERYGMSEAVVITTNPLEGERIAGTVGYALPGVQVRVADADGVPVSAGDIGMIEVSGQSLFSGYWQMPEKTAEEMRSDGFFITGDLGTLTADGRLTIVGRSKDLIISGGYNVYPKEVEQALDELAEIAESAVFGVPHADFGEAVIAAVVPQADDVLLAAVDTALADVLARFKQPKRVINLKELPRNTMGKVQKNKLREQYVDLFAAPTEDE